MSPCTHPHAHSPDWGTQRRTRDLRPRGLCQCGSGRSPNHDTVPDWAAAVPSLARRIWLAYVDSRGPTWKVVDTRFDDPALPHTPAVVDVIQPLIRCWPRSAGGNASRVKTHLTTVILKNWHLDHSATHNPRHLGARIGPESC
jgi:hypothetical protein